MSGIAATRPARFPGIEKTPETHKKFSLKKSQKILFPPKTSKIYCIDELETRFDVFVNFFCFCLFSILFETKKVQIFLKFSRNMLGNEIKLKSIDLRPSEQVSLGWIRFQTICLQIFFLLCLSQVKFFSSRNLSLKIFV